jgi:hypothetical protein
VTSPGSISHPEPSPAEQSAVTAAGHARQRYMLDDQELTAKRREAFIEFDEDPDPSAELTRRYAELNNEFIRRRLWTRDCNAQR